jgi:surface antigen
MATNLVNPGSVWQSYNPNTGVTTYGGTPTINYSGTGAAVATPTNLPQGVGTPQVATAQGTFVPLTAQTGYSQATPDSLPTPGNYTGNFKPMDIPTVVPTAATSTTPEANKVLAQAQTAEAVKQNLKPGDLIRNDEQLLASGLKERDLARTTGLEIYRRDLAKEQQTMPKYVQTYGKTPSSDAEWRQFHDMVYKANTPPPGAKGDGGPTDTIPDASIATTDNTIDPVKIIAKLQADLQGINDLITSTQESIDETTTAYNNSINEVGHELGTVAPLIQGEQAYQENQKQIQLQAKEMRLQRLVDEKANVIQSGELQLKVADYARQLRQDQQTAMASMLDMYLQNGIPLTKSMADQYSRLTGIDSQMIQDGFAVAAKNYLEKQKTQNASDQLDLALKQKQLSATESGTWSVTQTGIDDNGNPIYSQMNSKTGEIQQLSNSTSNLLQPGAIGGQCGAYPKKIMDGTPAYGDQWTDKQKFANTTPQAFASAPQVGDQIIQKTKMPYGHVSVVTAVNGNQVTVTESNWGGDEKVGTRTISATDSSITGVYRGATFKTSGTSTTNTTAENWVKQIQNGTAKLSDVPDKLKSAVINAMGPSIIQSKTTTTALQDNITLVDKILTKDNLSAAVGPNLLTRGTISRLTGSKAVAIADIQKLISNESLASLIEAKKNGATFGALSDREMDILSNAATSLSAYAIKDKNGKVVGYEAPESSFKEELNRLKTSYQNLLNNNGGALPTAPSGITWSVPQTTPSGITYTISQ